LIVFCWFLAEVQILSLPVAVSSAVKVAWLRGWLRECSYCFSSSALKLGRFIRSGRCIIRVRRKSGIIVLFGRHIFVFIFIFIERLVIVIVFLAAASVAIVVIFHAGVAEVGTTSTLHI
jgi:hypothetical protein